MLLNKLLAILLFLEILCGKLNWFWLMTWLLMLKTEMTLEAENENAK
jgi:hypothetical protein